MATFRSTEGFTFSPKHWGNPFEACCDLDIVTRNTPIPNLGRAATPDSVGLRVHNRLTDRAAIFGLDGTVLERGGVDANRRTGEWGKAAGATAGLQDKAQALLAKLLADPAALEAEIGSPLDSRQRKAANQS